MLKEGVFSMVDSRDRDGYEAPMRGRVGHSLVI